MEFNIRRIRRAQDLTQEQLAQKSGVSRVTIQQLERNKKAVTTTKTLIALADALGVSLDELILRPGA